MTLPLTSSDLASQAEDTIRALTHLTRLPATETGDLADLAGALARLTGMLPQLLDQLADRLDYEHRAGHLHLDTAGPRAETDQMLRALTDVLHAAADDQRRAATNLDAAHQHTARLTLQQPGPPPDRGQNSCRSVGPNHLTKPRCATLPAARPRVHARGPGRAGSAQRCGHARGRPWSRHS